MNKKKENISKLFPLFLCLLGAVWRFGSLTTLLFGLAMLEKGKKERSGELKKGK